MAGLLCPIRSAVSTIVQSNLNSRTRSPTVENERVDLKPYLISLWIYEITYPQRQRVCCLSMFNSRTESNLSVAGFHQNSSQENFQLISLNHFDKVLQFNPYLQPFQFPLICELVHLMEFPEYFLSLVVIFMCFIFIRTIWNYW